MISDKGIVLLAALAVAGAGLTGCGTKDAPGPSSAGVVPVVAAELQYGDVASQIGGRWVKVTSVESNPDTDPHTYEVSPRTAEVVAGAGLVIENGVGYDPFMDRLESASANRRRLVVDVQSLLDLPDTTPNPHLWYAPSTMPAVARAVAADLGRLEPGHRAYFDANVTRFDASLRPWLDAIAAFQRRYGGTPVATTEPVADYLLSAMGVDDLTPFAFQADIMNGTDPTPQDVALENALLSRHRVRVFVYNQQVVDPLTRSIRSVAQRAGVPVVGVYETMPTPGYHYQSWMLAETEALTAAVAAGRSTLSL